MTEDDVQNRPKKLTRQQWGFVLKGNMPIDEVEKIPQRVGTRLMLRGEYIYEEERDKDQRLIDKVNHLRNTFSSASVLTPDERAGRIAALNRYHALLKSRASAIEPQMYDYERDVIDVISPDNNEWRRRLRTLAAKMEREMMELHGMLKDRIAMELDEYQRMINQDRRQALHTQIAHLHALKPETYVEEDQEITGPTEDAAIREVWRLEERALREVWLRSSDAYGDDVIHLPGGNEQFYTDFPRNDRRVVKPFIGPDPTW